MIHRHVFLVAICFILLWGKTSFGDPLVVTGGTLTVEFTEFARGAFGMTEVGTTDATAPGQLGEFSHDFAINGLFGAERPSTFKFESGNLDGSDGVIASSGFVTFNDTTRNIPLGNWSIGYDVGRFVDGVNSGFYLENNVVGYHPTIAKFILVDLGPLNILVDDGTSLVFSSDELLVSPEFSAAEGRPEINGFNIRSSVLVTATVATVPEPSAWAVVTVGLLGFVAKRRRQLSVF